MISEFSHAPITIPLRPGGDVLNRLRILLGHYDLRVYLSDHAYIDVGRGSLDAVFCVSHVMPDSIGCLGTIGQFCEFAQPCKLFGGGEHQNELPVNLTFSTVPALTWKIANEKLESLRPKKHQPFTIKNAVVVSADAKVMPGATLENGVVLAANALTRGETQAFAIYGGTPAKILRQRFDDETRQKLETVHWWDWDLVYLANNIARLQELAVDTSAPHIYRKPAPRFTMRIAPQIQLLGFVDGQVQRPASEMPQSAIDYVKQIGSDGPCQWVADVWNL
jgi:acetyltransferase-like isoleucine patch superfamily enzyme